MNQLTRYGVNQRFITEATLFPDLYLARVLSQYKDIYKIITEGGECLAEVSGKFRYEASGISDYPAVGDFVMVDRINNETGNVIIHNVLTRKSVFMRTAVGDTHESQVIAANIDTVFICMSLNNDYNLSRLERYLSVAWNSGANPVVVLTKADLCDNLPGLMAEISTVAPCTDIIATSSYDNASCQKLLPWLKAGTTASLIGSSGVGKSTLINCLMGKNMQETFEIRQDDKGRHTTTRREMLILPQGGIVIDTPGMRELGALSVDLSKSFSDIDVLISKCRFSDCTHVSEPGCAIRQALEEGVLDARRFENYLKLKREAKYDGLSSKEIEVEKLNIMFKEVGGMKKARKYIHEKNKRLRKDY